MGKQKTAGLIPPWRSAVLSEVEIGAGGLIDPTPLDFYKEKHYRPEKGRTLLAVDMPNTPPRPQGGRTYKIYLLHFALTQNTMF